MNRRTVCVVRLSPLVPSVAALMLMLAAGRASAAVVLDQAYLDEGGTFGFGGAAAQTFTVGITGQLSRIELRLGRIGSPNGNFFAYVRNAQDISTGPNLGALTVSRSSLPFPIQPNTYIGLDFLSQDIHVNAGEQYAIIVDARDTPDVEWGLGETVQDSQGFPIGGYAGGHSMVGDSNGFNFVLLPYNPSHSNVVGLDYNFRTFVQPIPEPSTPTLAVIAVSTLLCRGPVRRRRPRM